MNIYCKICGKQVGKEIKGFIRKGTIHICKLCDDPEPQPYVKPDIGMPDFLKDIFKFE